MNDYIEYIDKNGELTDQWPRELVVRYILGEPVLNGGKAFYPIVYQVGGDKRIHEYLYSRPEAEDRVDVLNAELHKGEE